MFWLQSLLILFIHFWFYPKYTEKAKDHLITDMDIRDSVPFAPGRDLANGSIEGISALAVADLNSDGHQDVLVLEGGKHAGGRMTVGWLSGATDPDSPWLFHPLPRPDPLVGETPLTPFIGSAQVADLDEDGDTDIVLTMDKHSGSELLAFMYILENPGVGAENPELWNMIPVFNARRWHHINDMILSDMDGNGLYDIVIRVLEPNQLVIFLQSDLQSWQERSIDGDRFGNTGEGFAIGDLDQQGNPDIAIGGYWLATPTNILSGEFLIHPIDTTYILVNQNTKQAIGDINRDGINDVVISPAEGYRIGGNHELVWYQASPGSAEIKTWIKHVVKSDFNGGHTVKLADMDGDGDIDLISGVCWNLWGQKRHISVYYNENGEGNFGTPQIISSDQGLYTGCVSDLDGDGDLDIIGQNEYAAKSRPYFYENLIKP